jgi:Fe-S-cluster containining protein
MTALTRKIASVSTTAHPVLPQLVPGSACVRCDVCCRFPDSDSPLRPYFTAPEISRAVDAGVDERSFPDRSGSQIAVVPDSQGEGFQCPAFDSRAGTCRIYEQRPLDCQLYPLAMMWNAAQDEVFLGWDTKCPFMQDRLPESIRIHADRVLEILQRPDVIRTVANHPRLIGRFQEDVVVLAPLTDITRALSERWGLQPVRRLMLEDLSRLATALERSGLCGVRSLAAYSVPYHYIWNGLLAYWWTEIQEAFCLFIQSPDGWFMPLPPLTAGAIEGPVAGAFQVMRRWNGDTPVGRIENVPVSLAADLEAMGYRVTPKDPDYLYRAADLASLAGDRYKSQRALCNRVERSGAVIVEPYRLRDRTECRALFHEWRRQKRAEGLDSFAGLLLDDVLSAHEAAWSHGPDLHLAGSVLRIEGRIQAYTFGHWLNKDTWCVLLEVADRTVPGLAQYLFRDTCRKVLAQGAEFINTMDDSGLSGLRLSKQAYHPLMRIQNFICIGTPRA